MLLTEEEAEKKFCQETFNAERDKGALCITSKCMAWRWFYDKKIAKKQLSEHYIVMEKYRTNKGCCGKVGKLE